MAWSRDIFPCSSLDDFLTAARMGCFDDPEGEAILLSWLADDAPCQGDGWDPNPLLVGPAISRLGAMVSGEIRDGQGFHPAATFAATREAA